MVDVSDVYRERCFVAIDRDGKVFDDFGGKCNQVDYQSNRGVMVFNHYDDFKSKEHLTLGIYSYESIAGVKLVEK